jgi:hypothetical protein
VAAAHDQMRLELSRAYADAQERIVLTPCLNQRITQLEDRLVQTKGAWTPLPPMIVANGGKVLPGGSRAIVAAGRAWDDQFWRMSLNDGTVAHMDRALQPRLARIYWQIGMIGEQNRQEAIEVQGLNALNLSFPLDDGTRAALLQALEREQGRANIETKLSGALSAAVRGAVTIDMSIPQSLLRDSVIIRSCRELGLL